MKEGIGGRRGLEEGEEEEETKRTSQVADERVCYNKHFRRQFRFICMAWAAKQTVLQIKTDRATKKAKPPGIPTQWRRRWPDCD